jgi:hypothetical protein
MYLTLGALFQDGICLIFGINGINLIDGSFVYLLYESNCFAVGKNK